jgi:uncharacterized protein (TIRG00374 family)
MKNIFLPTLKVFFSIGILWFLFNNFNLKETIQLVLESDKKFLALAILVLLFQIFLANFRWHKVLTSLEIIFSFSEVLRILWIGLFFYQILPSSMGGDAFRSYYIFKSGFKIKTSIISVLIDRVIGLIALVLFVISTLSIALDLIDQSSARIGVLIIAFSSFITLILLMVLDKLSINFKHLKFFKGLHEFSMQSRALILSKSTGFKLILISLLIHLLSIFAIFLLSNSMKIELSFIGIMIIMPLASLLMTVPISIAGWGVREGVMVIGFGFLSVSPEAALAISLLYGLLMLITSLPGLVIWLLHDREYIHKVK